MRFDKSHERERERESERERERIYKASAPRSKMIEKTEREFAKQVLRGLTAISEP